MEPAHPTLADIAADTHVPSISELLARLPLAEVIRAIAPWSALVLERQLDAASLAYERAQLEQGFAEQAALYFSDAERQTLRDELGLLLNEANASAATAEREAAEGAHPVVEVTASAPAGAQDAEGPKAESCTCGSLVPECDDCRAAREHYQAEHSARTTAAGVAEEPDAREEFVAACAERAKALAAVDSVDRALSHAELRVLLADMGKANDRVLEAAMRVAPLLSP